MNNSSNDKQPLRPKHEYEIERTEEYIRVLRWQQVFAQFDPDERIPWSTPLSDEEAVTVIWRVGDMLNDDILLLALDRAKQLEELGL